MIFLVSFVGWMVYRQVRDPEFLRHYFSIGLPGISVRMSYLQNLLLMKEYLHNGIGKWFWPGIISVLVGIIRSNDLVPLFNQNKRFILITHQWRLEKEKIPKDWYQILDTDRDKILLTRK